MRLYTAHVPPWQVFTTRLCLLAVTIQYVQSQMWNELYHPYSHGKLRWEITNAEGWTLEKKFNQRYRMCEADGKRHELTSPYISRYLNQEVRVTFWYLFQQQPQNDEALEVHMSRGESYKKNYFPIDKNIALNTFHAFTFWVNFTGSTYCGLKFKFYAKNSCVKVSSLHVKAKSPHTVIVPVSNGLKCTMSAENACIKPSTYTYSWDRSDRPRRRQDDDMMVMNIDDFSVDTRFWCSVHAAEIGWNMMSWSNDDGPFLASRKCPANVKPGKCCEVSGTRCVLVNDVHSNEFTAKAKSKGRMNTWNILCVILSVNLMLWQ